VEAISAQYLSLFMSKQLSSSTLLTTNLSL